MSIRAAAAFRQPRPSACRVFRHAAGRGTRIAAAHRLALLTCFPASTTPPLAKPPAERFGASMYFCPAHVRTKMDFYSNSALSGLSDFFDSQRAAASKKHPPPDWVCRNFLAVCPLSSSHYLIAAGQPLCIDKVPAVIARVDKYAYRCTPV